MYQALADLPGLERQTSVPTATATNWRYYGSNAKIIARHWGRFVGRKQTYTVVWTKRGARISLDGFRSFKPARGPYMPRVHFK